MWKQVVARVRKAPPASEALPPAVALERPVAIEPPAPLEPPIQPRLIFPDELIESADDARRSARGDVGRAVRAVAYVVLGALAGIGVLSFFPNPLRPPIHAGAQPPVSAAEPAPETDAAALTAVVAQAVSSFDLRARMFESHQMQCA